MVRNFNFIFFVYLFLGCQNKTMNIDKQTQKERAVFYNVFGDKTLLRGGERDTSLIILKTYNKNNEINEYYLTKKGENLLLVRDTLQYIDTVTKNDLTSLIKTQLTIFDNFKINSVSAAMRNQGIDLKIYLKDGSIRLYIKNPEIAENGLFKDYFKTAKIISNNWYAINE